MLFFCNHLAGGVGRDDGEGDCTFNFVLITTSIGGGPGGGPGKGPMGIAFVYISMLFVHSYIHKFF